MKFRSLFAVAAVLAMVTSAQAVSLTVMNVATNASNSAIPVGQQVVTFGIEVKESDLVGAGTNPVLFVQYLTFAGNGIVPINGPNGATNKVDVQTVQTSVVDVAANNTTPVPPAQGDLTANGQKALYADSWWYNGGSGTIQGVNDINDNSGTITDPAFQLGPIKYIGPTGFQWTPNGATGVQAGATAAAAVASAGGSNATTGQYMVYSGFYGPNGSNGLTGSTLAGQFHNGVLTVPIAQIVTTGDVNFPGSYSNAAGGVPGASGSGTYIGVIGNGVSNGPTGNGTYNAIGGNPNVDASTLAHYDFQAQKIVVPEPGSIVLLGMGALGMFFAWKRRK